MDNCICLWICVCMYAQNVWLWNMCVCILFMYFAMPTFLPKRWMSCREMELSSTFWCQCYKTFFLRYWRRGPKARVFVLGNPFQSGLRIWGQGQSQPNWSTFQLLPSWVSSWCFQQMLDYTVKWLSVQTLWLIWPHRQWWRTNVLWHWHLWPVL